MLDFGRDICNNLPAAEAREWLVTNGIGGFACGTVAGTLTRRYHGLLVAALRPPLGRTLLLTKLDETVIYHKRIYPLFENHWHKTTPKPGGVFHMERFHLEGTVPVWTFTCGDALLEKRVWMQSGANTTYIRYDVRRSTAPITLTGKAIVNYRDYHSSTHASNWQMQITPTAHGLQIVAFSGATPFYLLSNQIELVPKHEWYHNYYLSIESYRGLPAVEDHLHAGTFQATLQPGQSITLVATTESTPNLDGATAYSERQDYEQQLIARSEAEREPAPDEAPVVRRLTLAADQFIVCRRMPDDPDGRSILAGYPWFGDWGRDTMIALPGLALSTGRPEVARSILTTFARFVDQGMLPNRFPDTTEIPEYNTVDATLWYFHAIYQYLRHTADNALAAELYPVLVNIIDWHKRGTRYNIHVDTDDGLLYAGKEGMQLTWMDAKVGDWVVTPRIGKPVEINALWHTALHVMAYLSQKLGKTQAAQLYKQEAARVAKNFRRRFWFADGGYLYDVIDGPNGNPDPSLRPNQIFAVSLPFALLSATQSKSVVDVCTRHLLTPHGLRSLARREPAYIGRYGGGQRQRDSAYHQGTVWAWLMGPFVRAHLRVYRDPALAHSFLQPLIRQLASHGVGSLSEIFDGDPPFTPRGCFAQAWSIAEVLRAVTSRQPD